MRSSSFTQFSSLRFVLTPQPTRNNGPQGSFSSGGGFLFPADGTRLGDERSRLAQLTTFKLSGFAAGGKGCFPLVPLAGDGRSRRRPLGKLDGESLVRERGFVSASSSLTQLLIARLGRERAALSSGKEQGQKCFPGSAFGHYAAIRALVVARGQPESWRGATDGEAAATDPAVQGARRGECEVWQDKSHTTLFEGLLRLQVRYDGGR